jgi:hypothetical protein
LTVTTSAGRPITIEELENDGRYHRLAYTQSILWFYVAPVAANDDDMATLTAIHRNTFVQSIRLDLQISPTMLTNELARWIEPAASRGGVSAAPLLKPKPPNAMAEVCSSILDDTPQPKPQEDVPAPPDDGKKKTTS